MAIHTIAVWERSPYWVPELQRSLDSETVRVVSCRIVGDARQRIGDGANQLVIALPPGERLPIRLVKLWAGSSLKLHVILHPEDEPLRWFLCELGVTSVLDFREARNALAGLCAQRANLSPRRLSVPSV